MHSFSFSLFDKALCKMQGSEYSAVRFRHLVVGRGGEGAVFVRLVASSSGTSASEVRLFGSNRTVLRAPNGSSLLAMLSGAPPVSLYGITLRGQLVVEAGSLLTMSNCTLEGVAGSIAHELMFH